MRKITKIIIHCAATPEGKDFTVQQIDQWHRQRGFSCIGYHFVIYRDGSIHKGRPIEQVGAHTTGQNARSIGICLIGGCAADGKTPKDTRTEAQRAALIKLVGELKASYPSATVHGHNEFAAKACPSFNVPADSVQKVKLFCSCNLSLNTCSQYRDFISVLPIRIVATNNP